jgi:hypothetical protein
MLALAPKWKNSELRRCRRPSVMLFSDRPKHQIERD